MPYEITTVEMAISDSIVDMESIITLLRRRSPSAKDREGRRSWSEMVDVRARSDFEWIR